MRKTRARAVALAALALWGIASAGVRDDVDRIGARDERESARQALPRTAAGAIDVPRLIVELRAALTRGARDIHFHDATLEPNDAKTLHELAARFGFERVRIRDEGRGVRVEFHDIESKDRERAGVRKDVRDDTVTRVELRERAPKPERAERPERADHPQRPERPERGERPDRSGRH